MNEVARFSPIFYNRNVFVVYQELTKGSQNPVGIKVRPNPPDWEIRAHPADFGRCKEKVPNVF